MDAHPSDSQAWRTAEGSMLDWLSVNQDIELLRNHRILVDGKVTVELDGYSESPPLLCEAYGRLGYVAGTTLAKACQDAYKMTWVRDRCLPGARTILLVANAELERRLTTGRSWRAAMLHDSGVEVFRATLSDEQLVTLHDAEARARRGMIPPLEDEDLS